MHDMKYRTSNVSKYSCMCVQNSINACIINNEDSDGQGEQGRVEWWHA